MASEFDLNAIIGQMGRDKGIDKTVLIEAVESAMLSAARRHFGHNLNLEAHFNPESGEVEVLEFKTVVDEVMDSATEVDLENARKDYDPDAQVGDELGRKLPTQALGRIAAQTAKQVIMQKVRDAERSVIYEEFKNCKGDLINGIVQRYDRGDIVVNLGRTEATLPKREQIVREKYRQGDRLRCMILDIDSSARGPQIILTRSHPDFLRKLFELEVPEIAEKTIEIKAVAREPGERAKIAVVSSDSDVDPVGACVGIKGSRVQAVVQELRGERVDIITWTPDEPSFVAKALAPAEVQRVLMDETEHSMEVIVPDEQLALAIGRRGTNVKLASKLTGWRIDVRSNTVAESEAKLSRKALEAIPGIDFTQAEMLFQEGYRSARQVSEQTAEDLAEIEGFTLETGSELLKSAREYVSQLEESGAKEIVEEQAAVSDIRKLKMPPAVEEKLIAGGLGTTQLVMGATFEQMLNISGFTEDDLAVVRDCIDALIRSSPRPGARTEAR